MAALLVGGVVAAGPVGAREPQVELAVVVGPARDVEADVADDHDRGAVAGKGGGEADRVVGARRRGADEDRVGPARPGGLAVELAAQRDLGARVGREVAEPLGEVDAEHPAAGGERDPDGELADQAEADDGDARADLDVGAPEAVHRDRAERREGGVLERDPVGDRRAEQARDDVDLGVVGGAGAGDGDPVAGPDPADLAADLDRDAGGAVAERAELVEALAHELDGRADALAAGALDHLPRLLGPRASLRDQPLAGDVEGRALGPGGDERGLDVDRDRAGVERGVGDLDQLEATVAQPAGDLPHRPSPVAASSASQTCATDDSSSPGNIGSESSSAPQRSALGKVPGR